MDMNSEAKSRQREILKGRLSALSDDDIAMMNRQMCDLFVGSELFEGADVIMAYMAMANEADPAGIIRAAMDAGKMVAVPVIDWDLRRIKPAILESLTGGLEKDRYGILTPVEPRFIAVSRIDAVIVPGLGFDKNGNRLGRGGGFYDKFFSDNALTAVKCGFAFSVQILDDIAVSDRDRKVDCLITESGTWKCG